MTKWVFTFGDGKAEGQAGMRDLLGGKGANLAEMSNLGLPVPPGFTITTEVCTYYYDNGETYPADLDAQVQEALAQVGVIAGTTFGDPENPLLVSVRSGARASMPGMMDTVLNLGLNDVTVEAIAKSSGDARFAYDSYRRFIQMYSDVVLGVGHHHLRGPSRRVQGPEGLHARHRPVRRRLEDPGREVQGDGAGRARQAVPAGSQRPALGRDRRRVRLLDEPARHQVPRAEQHSRRAGAPPSMCRPWCSAIMGETSATGVAFTRNPSTGAKELYGEFLINAQGEDVVAGIRTPQDITEEARIAAGSDRPSLERAMPEAYAEFIAHLRAAREALPRHAGRRVHDRDAASSGCSRRATASARPRRR